MKYEYVASVRSMTKPDKFYTIKKDEHGHLSCSCPAWIFNHSGDRTCKHIIYYNTHQGKARFELIETEVRAIKKNTPKNVEVPNMRFALLDMD